MNKPIKKKCWVAVQGESVFHMNGNPCIYIQRTKPMVYGGDILKIPVVKGILTYSLPAKAKKK